jgi:Mce-associated membrane protein
MAEQKATLNEPDLEREAPARDTTVEEGTAELATDEQGTGERGTAELATGEQDAAEQDATPEVAEDSAEATKEPEQESRSDESGDDSAAEGDRGEADPDRAEASSDTSAADATESSENAVARESESDKTETVDVLGSDKSAAVDSEPEPDASSPPAETETAESATVQTGAVHTEAEESSAATDVDTPASAQPLRVEPAGKPRSKRRLVVAAMVVVLVAMWVACGVLVHAHRGALRTEAAHRAALTVARQVATDLTSLGGADPQASIEKLQATTTGSFRDQVAQFNSAAQAMLRESNADSRGTVTAAGIESGDTEHAVALVTVTQMISNNKLPSAQSVNLRLSIQLQRAGETWLASNVTYIP